MSVATMHEAGGTGRNGGILLPIALGLVTGAVSSEF